jgi:hypothetical protein
MQENMQVTATHIDELHERNSRPRGSKLVPLLETGAIPTWPTNVQSACISPPAFLATAVGVSYRMSCIALSFLQAPIAWPLLLLDPFVRMPPIAVSNATIRLATFGTTRLTAGAATAGDTARRWACDRRRRCGEAIFAFSARLLRLQADRGWILLNLPRCSLDQCSRKIPHKLLRSRNVPVFVAVMASLTAHSRGR